MRVSMSSAWDGFLHVLCSVQVLGFAIVVVHESVVL